MSITKWLRSASTEHSHDALISRCQVGANHIDGLKEEIREKDKVIEELKVHIEELKLSRSFLRTLVRKVNGIPNDP